MEISVTIGSKTLRCVPDAPPMAVLDLMSARDNGAALVKATVDFLRGVVVDEDMPILEEILRSKTEIVPLDVVAKIVTDLVEVYTARPTTSPNGSVPGDSADGPSSAPL